MGATDNAAKYWVFNTVCHFSSLIFPDLVVPIRAHDVDLRKLPLGDGKISKAPKAGWIWACHVDPNGGGEAAARSDFDFYTEAGQMQGPAADLKVEDYWDLGPLNRAKAKLGS